MGILCIFFRVYVKVKFCFKNKINVMVSWNEFWGLWGNLVFYFICLVINGGEFRSIIVIGFVFYGVCLVIEDFFYG